MMVGGDAKTLGLVSLFTLSGNIFMGEVYSYIMTFEQIVILAIGAFITAIIQAIVSRFQKLHEQHQEEQKERDKTVDGLVVKIDDALEELKQFEELHEDIRDLSLQLDTLKHSIKSILRDRIIQSCRVFIERGSITLTAKENICGMYKWYSALGGNGTCKYYFTEMDNLPVDNTPTVPRVKIPEEGGNLN